MLGSSNMNSKLNRIYNTFIMIVAVLSLVPLMSKDDGYGLRLLDHITVYILFFDYILRWTAYDKLSRLKRPWAFILYPLTPLAIFDLISLLPSLGLLGEGFRVLRILRLFKLLRYSKSFTKILKALKKEEKTLGTVLLIAIVYIFISALVMFAYEPQTFNTFFDALYWATTALTTVGYGDIAPATNLGRLISMVSSLFGIAVIALPAGIITTSFVEEINKSNDDDEQNRGVYKRVKKGIISRLFKDSSDTEENTEADDVMEDKNERKES